MASEWKPIDTAPKDRTILVGWWTAGVWFVRNAWWEDGFDPNTGSIERIDAGWWYSNTSVGTYKICRANNAVDSPQYWMEMPPEPPEADPALTAEDRESIESAVRLKLKKMNFLGGATPEVQ